MILFVGGKILSYSRMKMLIFKELDAPYVIAEIGCNHNGDTKLGLKMIKAAKDSGANAVKFQYFTKENLVTDEYLNDLDSGAVKIENVTSWKTEELNLSSVREQIDEFINSKKQLKTFRDYANELGIDFGCTPVDEAGVLFLKEIESDFIKLASMDADNESMIQAAIDAKLPLIISTGMSDLQEIDTVYNIFKSNGVSNFSLLHTVSIYPPREEIVNLNFIDTLKKLYDCEIGYSDHTLGFSVALAAIGKGVKIIEKHFTLDKNMPGCDHKVSADEDDMAVIATEGLKIFKSLGSTYKVLSSEELEKRKKFRRSVTTKKKLEKGHVLCEDDIVFKRPGTGIRPKELKYVIGRKLNKPINSDVTLLLEDFE